jgi:hypothetical protein
MKRLLIISAAALALAGCGTALKTAPAAQPASPVKPDPRICADIEDEPKPDGGFPRPISPAAIAAVDRFNDAELDMRQWGRRGWGRAKIAKDQFCTAGAVSSGSPTTQ